MMGADLTWESRPCPGMSLKITILKSQPAQVGGTDWGKQQPNRPDRNLEGDLGSEVTEEDNR